MIDFRVERHAFRRIGDVVLVEVWDDQQLIATVYAQADEIKVVSKYASAAHFDQRFPAATTVTLDRNLVRQ